MLREMFENADKYSRLTMARIRTGAKIGGSLLVGLMGIFTLTGPSQNGGFIVFQLIVAAICGALWVFVWRAKSWVMTEADRKAAAGYY